MYGSKTPGGGKKPGSRVTLPKGAPATPRTEHLHHTRPCARRDSWASSVLPMAKRPPSAVEAAPPLSVEPRPMAGETWKGV
jgi:hypothetical protein